MCLFARREVSFFKLIKPNDSLQLLNIDVCIGLTVSPGFGTSPVAIMFTMYSGCRLMRYAMWLVLECE